MKRVLLGSTALAAVGLLAAGAAAADGVTLKIGGRYKGAAGVVLTEDFSAASGVGGNDVRDYVFKQDVEVEFAGETVLDNGLRVGAAVTLEGQTTADDQIDSVYAYFSGGFGEVRFGDTDEAYAQLCYLVPSASELFGADSPDINFSNAGIAGYGATNGTCYGIDGSSTKLVYFSPTFAGFKFAASFTPDNTEDTRNVLTRAGTRLRNDDDAELREPLGRRAIRPRLQRRHPDPRRRRHGQLQQGGQPQQHPRRPRLQRLCPDRVLRHHHRRRHGAAREPRRRRRRPMGLWHRRHLRPRRLDVRPRLDARPLREGHRRKRRRPLQCRPRHLFGHGFLRARRRHFHRRRARILRLPQPRRRRPRLSGPRRRPGHADHILKSIHWDLS